MEKIIAQSILKSYGYQEYRNLITRLLEEGKSTGPIQTEALTKYSELNEVRMNRLDKTMEIPEDILSDLQNLSKKHIWLVLSEGWCGDAAQLIPVMNKMAESTPQIELKIALRDENEALMNLFLTNGGKAIPKLIILNADTLKVLSHWGPRPEGATRLIQEYKAQHGVVDETAKTELQKWYLRDKGLSTQKEIVALMREKIPVS